MRLPTPPSCVVPRTLQRSSAPIYGESGSWNVRSAWREIEGQVQFGSGIPDSNFSPPRKFYVAEDAVFETHPSHEPVPPAHGSYNPRNMSLLYQSHTLLDSLAVDEELKALKVMCRKLSTQTTPHRGVSLSRVHQVGLSSPMVRPLLVARRIPLTGDRDSISKSYRIAPPYSSFRGSPIFPGRPSRNCSGDVWRHSDTRSSRLRVWA